MRARVSRLPAVILLVLLVLVSAVAVRRARQHNAGSRSAETARPVPEIVHASVSAAPVIFVGLDGGDWELLDRYMAAGSMPNLSRLVREGTAGVLATIHPPLSPLVWTTMMTGVGPLEHRVLDFVRWNPAGRRLEPITSDERRAPAIWNMASYAGKGVAALGLWATYPAEPVNGLIVSDRLFSFLSPDEVMPPGTVSPAAEEGWARKGLARARDATSFAVVHGYLPWLEEEEYRRRADASDPYTHPVSALRRILIETRTYHELGTDWARRKRPDLTIVYLQGTDSIGHVFASYAPPRQEAIPETEYEKYRRVPEMYFRYVDGLLGEYRSLAETSGAVLMLASDHGFRWSADRPAGLSSFAHDTASEWHRPEGMYLLWGPGIPATGGHAQRGSVEQVCATLLALLGLPPADSGKPLPPARRRDGAAVDYRRYFRPPSRPPLERDPAAVDQRAVADQEALENLRALGYVAGAPGRPEGVESPGSTRTAGSYNNEALILRAQARTDEAIGASEKALRLDPGLASALWCLSDLLFAGKRDLDRSDELLGRAFRAGLPRGIAYLSARAREYQMAGDAARGQRLLASATVVKPDDAEAWLALGRYRIDQGDCARAASDLHEATRLAPRKPDGHASEGLARLCLGDEAAARVSLSRGNATLGQAHHALATAALARGDLARAAREARLGRGDPETELGSALVLAEVHLRRSEPRETLALLDKARARFRPEGAPPVPNLEFLRGDALARLGDASAAEAAFREEIRAFPASAQAYARLALIYGLERRPRGEIDGVLASMYAANPRRETALLAAKTLESLGETDAAEAWRRRAEHPGGTVRSSR